MSKYTPGIIKAVDKISEQLGIGSNLQSHLEIARIIIDQETAPSPPSGPSGSGSSTDNCPEGATDGAERDRLKEIAKDIYDIAALTDDDYSKAAIQMPDHKVILAIPVRILAKLEVALAEKEGE